MLTSCVSKSDNNFFMSFEKNIYQEIHSKVAVFFIGFDVQFSPHALF